MRVIKYNHDDGNAAQTLDIADPAFCCMNDQAVTEPD
jgi:hypothetical protein